MSPVTSPPHTPLAQSGGSDKGAEEESMNILPPPMSLEMTLNSNLSATGPQSDVVARFSHQVSSLTDALAEMERSLLDKDKEISELSRWKTEHVCAATGDEQARVSLSSTLTHSVGQRFDGPVCNYVR
jgi:hypothetical protein